MRKVPNVNTHIFKQPGLPWQTASFSDAALAAFAKYDTLGDGLTDAEKTAMAAYIDAETAAGNQAKKDYETIFSLSGNNALVDYVGGKVATAVNAPTQSVNGFTFDGATNYLQSNFTQSIHYVNGSLNDSQAEAFVKTAMTSGIGSIFGGLLNLVSGTSMFDDKVNNRVSARNNSSAALVDNSDQISDNSLYSNVRTNSANFQILENGSQILTAAASSSSVTNREIFIGARNFQASSVDNFFSGTISTFMIGAVLVDQSSHYTNLSTLLTTLGAI